VLGGDHSLAAGSVAAAAAWARRTRGLRIGLLWLDAHGDMNTPATSPSGNVHGMPLAALLGPEPAELALECLWGHGKRGRPTLAHGVVTEEDRQAHRARAERVALRRTAEELGLGSADRRLGRWIARIPGG